MTPKRHAAKDWRKEKEEKERRKKENTGSIWLHDNSSFLAFFLSLSLVSSPPASHRQTDEDSPDSAFLHRLNIMRFGALSHTLKTAGDIPLILPRENLYSRCGEGGASNPLNTSTKGRKEVKKVPKMPKFTSDSGGGKIIPLSPSPLSN